ncbi:MAG: oligoribonuclease [Gammaproteobacteria bacterium]
MALSEKNLIWIDLEMTGLDPDQDRILEIATVVTDSELDVIAQGPVLAIRQDEAILATMDEWNKEQHTRSGLLKRVRASQVSDGQAEQRTLAFLRQLVPAGKSPMCGNSICLDRRFLYRYMPELERYFHYRNLDVSTIKELASRWAPTLGEFQKESSHLALDDILESIGELRYFRNHVFKI